MQIHRFTPESAPVELLDRFLSLRERVYSDDYYYYPDRDQERTLLEYYASRPDYRIDFILLERAGAGDVGRLLVARTAHLPWPFFGFFECEDNPGTFRSLIGKAESIAREYGASELRGPIDLNPFDGWMFLVESATRERWPGDPFHKPFYPELFHDTGEWDVVEEAFSGQFSMDFSSELAAQADGLINTLARYGVQLTTRDRQDADTLLSSIYGLVNESFNAEEHGYVPVPEKVFLAKYRPYYERLTDPYNLLAFTRGEEVVGYSLAFANFIETLCNPDGAKRRLDVLATPPLLALKSAAISANLFGGPLYKCILALLARRGLELYDRPLVWRRMNRRRRHHSKAMATSKITHVYQLFRKRLR